MNLLEFESLSKEMKSSGLDFRASEWHGFICGALAMDLTYPLHTSVQTLSSSEMKVAISAELNEQMLRACEIARTQMTDSNLEFELCLPDSDSYDLHSRVNELAAWCNGFLYGLANAGLKPGEHLSRDVQEILHDFTRISQLSDMTAGEEDDEVAYNEIIEFVRMASLLIAEEIQPLKDNLTTH
jgi:uncharacterized protein YgfB (UPF0149 family)